MSSIPVVFTAKAKSDIAAFKADDFGGVDPETFHKEKVESYYADNKKGSLAEAVKAKVRRGAHTGGTDPNEKDHITVSFKDAKNKDVGGGGVHVYTGR